MKNSIYKVFAAAVFVSGLASAQRPAPAPKQTVPVAITGATIHTAAGNVLQNGTIVFENGKITSLNGAVPSNAKVISAAGKHVYPCLLYTSPSPRDRG